jgi:hypothetical protein
MYFIRQTTLGLLRGAVAVWLLMAFGTCSVLPAVTVFSRPPAGCCGGHGHGSCCRKSHAAGSGSFWAAGADCAQGCRLPASLSAGSSWLAAPRATASGVAAISEPLRALPAAHFGLTSYVAFLYQRPPPSL